MQYLRRDEAEVRKAVEDASYVFVGALERVRSLMCPLARLLQAVTNYWKHVDKAREIAEGKLMVDAAKAADIKLFILSSKPSVTNLLKGRLDKVSHCDSKAEASDYARSTGIRIVDIHVGGRMSNFVSFAKPQSAGDGSYVVAVSWKPECRMPLIDTYHDAGLFVRLAIESNGFKKGDGKIIFAYAEWVTVGDQVKILSETLGKKVHYMQMTDEQLSKGMPERVIDDILQMYRYHEELWGKTYIRSNRENLARRPRTFSMLTTYPACRQ